MSGPISDETLTAYLDGELDAATRKSVEEALQRDANLAIRLGELDVPVDGIVSAFDTVLSDAPEFPNPQPERTQKIWFRTAGLAAALAAGLAIGLMWSFSSDRLDWKVAVANYQVLYVPATLGFPPPDPEQAERTIADLSEALGRDLSPAREPSGLSFRRAQMLGLDGAPLVQMAYVSASSIPFAICVTPVNEGDYAPRTETLSGLSASHWVENGVGFLVIGGQDLEFVEEVARDLYSRI